MLQKITIVTLKIVNQLVTSIAKQIHICSQGHVVLQSRSDIQAINCNVSVLEVK